MSDSVKAHFPFSSVVRRITEESQSVLRRSQEQVVLDEQYLVEGG